MGIIGNYIVLINIDLHCFFHVSKEQHFPVHHMIGLVWPTKIESISPCLASDPNKTHEMDTVGTEMLQQSLWQHQHWSACARIKQNPNDATTIVLIRFWFWHILPCLLGAYFLKALILNLVIKLGLHFMSSITIRYQNLYFCLVNDFVTAVFMAYRGPKQD